LKDKDLEEATFKIDTQGDSFRLQQDTYPLAATRAVKVVRIHLVQVILHEDTTLKRTTLGTGAKHEFD
jgi:hypothetical protein